MRTLERELERAFEDISEEEGLGSPGTPTTPYYRLFRCVAKLVVRSKQRVWSDPDPMSLATREREYDWFRKFHSRLRGMTPSERLSSYDDQQAIGLIYGSISLVHDHYASLLTDSFIKETAKLKEKEKLVRR